MNQLLLLSGLLSLTLFVRSYFHPVLNPVGLGSDGYEYWHLATNLFTHHKFAYTAPGFYPLFHLTPLVQLKMVPSIIPCTTRLPGYPWILSLLQYFWDSPWAAIILNYLAYTGICIYGFLLSNIFFADRRFNMFYNFLLVFSPLYFVRWGIGSEFLAGFFITGFTYHYLQSINTSGRAYTHLFVACIWGLGANFTHGNLIIYTTSLILIALILGYIKKTKGVFAKSMIILLIFFFSLGAWMYRNYKLTDQWTLSTQGGFVLYHIHLGYTSTGPDTLIPELYKKSLRSGKTFNQTEAIADQQLKNMVLMHYKNNPGGFIIKTLDGIRTFFLFSHFDISDAIALLPQSSAQRLKFINSSSSRYKNNERLRQVLFQVSRAYKWMLLLGFFSLPIILLSKWPIKDVVQSRIFLLYFPTLLSVMTTAVFTGAGGDRMRLPFNAPILIFVLLSWQMLFPKKI